jgi:hypothetical protein
MNIVIEKDVPVPPVHERYGKFKNLLIAMDVGDSFLVDDNDGRKGIFSSARKYKQFVTSRREGEKIRIWKIAPPNIIEGVKTHHATQQGTQAAKEKGAASGHC